MPKAFWLRQRGRLAAPLVTIAVSAAGPAGAETVPAAVPDTPAASASSAPFGYQAFADGGADAVPQWAAMLARHEAEAAQIAACDAGRAGCPSAAAAAWRQAIAALQGRPPAVQLAGVDRAVNALVAYASDEDAFGWSDYWATPMEVLGRGSGDCEDYATLKFLSLLEFGIPAERMRVVVLRDLGRDTGHAVLAVELDGRFQVLDNLGAGPVADSGLPDYLPQYSVNLTTRWTHLAPAGLLAGYVP